MRLLTPSAMEVETGGPEVEGYSQLDKWVCGQVELCLKNESGLGSGGAHI